MDDGRKLMKHVPGIGLLGIGLIYMLRIDVRCTPSDGYFWGNLAVWWMPQAFVLGIALLFKPPIELLGGVTLAYGTFSLLAHAWSDFTLGWVGYLICTAGACVGVTVAALRSMVRVSQHIGIAAMDGFCCVAAGVAINALILRLLFP